MKFIDKIKEKKSPEQKEKKSFKESINRKYLKNGSYSVIISAVFIVIVIVVNLIVSTLPTKYTEFDITSEKLYSIGDTTKEYLKNLDKDVTIYQVVQSGSEDEKIEKLLEKYAEESDHITYQTKDPVVNPKFTSEYTDDEVSSNSLIVVCGDRSKVVDYDSIYETEINYNTYSYETTGFDGEGQITSAISYVTSDDLPVLYTLDGHGEADLNSTLKEDIEKANIDIQSLNLLTEENVPDDCDCLMINAPTTDLSEDESKAIIDYLENGGKAMIFSTYTTEDMPNFDSVLENYGVERVEGIVLEGDSQHYAVQMPYYLVPDVNSTDAISTFASSGYYVLAPYAQGIQKTDSVRDTVTIESLLTTSDDAYSKVDLNDTESSKTEDDIDGPFDLGVAITETVDGGETQIVYYSSSYMMEDQVNQMVSGGNEQMIMESLNWMCSTEETETISIPSKSLEVSYLTLTDYDSSFWKICVIGLIPGVFLVFGFVVWLKRRKA